jgi:hypothetical protein
MKKVFAILAVCGFVVACNNDSETETTTVKDSMAIKDSMERADKMKLDTTHVVLDTTTKTDTLKK